jgi:hypothetical protein
MSIARNPSCCGLLRSIRSSICRSYHSTAKDIQKTRNSNPRHTEPNTKKSSQPQMHERAKKQKPYKLFVPLAHPCSHISSSGRLYTSPEIWAFLQETGIEWDNSKAERLDLGADERQVNALFGCQIQYGPHYILNPFDLHHLRPGGSSMLPAVMYKYRQKLEEEPLWVFTTAQGGSAVVRSLMVKRISGAVWSAARDLGFSMDGPRGTVTIRIFDPLKVSRAPAHILGEAVAKAVQRRWRQHLRETAATTKPRMASSIQW